MTRLEVSNLARLYARMSSVYVSPTDLNLYLARAEVRTAQDMMEFNPGVAVLSDTFTWPSGAASVTLNSTLLPALGTNRNVWKILMLAERTQDNLWWWLYNAASFVELSGSAMPRDLGNDTATPQRWYSNGDTLLMYPVPTADIRMKCYFTRIPVPAAADGTTVLTDCSTAAREFSELVALRTAQMLIRDRGQVSTVIDAQVAEYETRFNSLFGKFQLQEQATIVGDRYTQTGT